jgi:hypothetical protein
MLYHSSHYRYIFHFEIFARHENMNTSLNPQLLLHILIITITIPRSLQRHITITCS